MKYSEILQFEPLTDLIQLDKLNDEDYRKRVVKDFVYPDYFISTIIPSIVKNLEFGGKNKKGIQIIGNYGTGKSHLMSVVSLIAENESYLNDVSNDKAKEILEPIAGKFLTLRFEMQTDKKLWDVVCFNIQRFLDAHGVDYHFDPDSLKMYGEQLDDMMAAFEEKYQGKGFLLIIDEMLSYLENHAAQGQLPHDLQVLQALGQQCAKGRFGFMFGVQEEIYKSPKFAFAAQMMLKVKDRYVDLTIRKEEVAFVVQNRLLRKNGYQKQLVRTHLQKFMPFFSDLHDQFEEYVELFPVHPSYFDNFQSIKLGRSHREVLRTLSSQFESIKDEEIPTDNPGLITYDSYFDRLMSDTAMKSIPDFLTVSDTVHIIDDKIDSNFDGVRKNYRPLAKRIVNAAAIKLLQGDISKKNGIRIETLVDDLCITSPLAEDKQFLIDHVNSVASLIIKATSGQYFDFNTENDEYYIRTEGGVNFDQQIIQFAETMSDARKDESFFRFMVVVLGITGDPYRTGFQIYQHELAWKSHKVTRDGYIFMGNPNEKSTTHPKQYFYMIFMPIFQEEKKLRNNEEDEIYFVMDGLSDDFKTLVAQYGAAFSLWNSADSAQKLFYKGKYEDLLTRTRRLFDGQYLSAVKVYYRDGMGKSLSAFQLPGQGASKMEIFDDVAGSAFEDQFNAQLPKYPAFLYAQSIIGHGNIDRYVRGAFAKIIRPSDSQRDGEAVLAGLGCYKSGEINIDDSIYAQSILKMMSERGEQKVVNKDEILEYLPQSDNVWRSRDYHLEAELEFVVLAAMVSIGECEVRLNNGETLNANTLDKLTKLQPDDYYTFASVKRPKNVNIQVIKELTRAFCGKDMSGQLDNPATYSLLTNEAKKKAEECAAFLARDLRPISISGIVVISDVERSSIDSTVTAFKGFCNQLQRFTSEAKLKNFPYDINVVKRQIEALKLMEATKEKIRLVKGLESEVNYLTQAQQYVLDGTPLKDTISADIGRLPEVLSDPTDKKIEAYQKELAEAKEKYIEYYLDRYYKFCISDIDNSEKTKTLNSGVYQACQVLSGSVLVNDAAWKNCRAMLFELRSADPRVEMTLRQTPYAGFNPLQKAKTDSKTVREIETEMSDIYTMWINQLKDYLRQEDTQKQMRMMDSKSQEFLDSFVDGITNIDDEHSARCLLELLNQLSEGFERVDISIEDFAGKYPRAMTIGEAEGAFELYVEQKCSGKDRDKVRIVIK